MKADMNEIVEGLYLGSVSAATDFEALQSHGITHVICAAKDLTPAFPLDFKYYYVDVWDWEGADLLRYCLPAARFILHARLNKESVLVHCRAGVSRSATLVAAYLLLLRIFEIEHPVTPPYNSPATPHSSIHSRRCVSLNSMLNNKADIVDPENPEEDDDTQMTNEEDDEDEENEDDSALDREIAEELAEHENGLSPEQAARVAAMDVDGVLRQIQQSRPFVQPNSFFRWQLTLLAELLRNSLLPGQTPLPFSSPGLFSKSGRLFIPKTKLCDVKYEETTGERAVIRLVDHLLQSERRLFYTHPQHKAFRIAMLNIERGDGCRLSRCYFAKDPITERKVQAIHSSPQSPSSPSSPSPSSSPSSFPASSSSSHSSSSSSSSVSGSGEVFGCLRCHRPLFLSLHRLDQLLTLRFSPSSSDDYDPPPSLPPHPPPSSSSSSSSSASASASAASKHKDPCEGLAFCWRQNYFVEAIEWMLEPGVAQPTSSSSSTSANSSNYNNNSLGIDNRNSTEPPKHPILAKSGVFHCPACSVPIGGWSWTALGCACTSAASPPNFFVERKAVLPLGLYG